MSERLDTVVLLREMKDRQRERASFNYQRVAVDSAMMVAIAAVGWMAVKLGLGLHELSRIAQDPAGAAADAARGVALWEQRTRLQALRKRLNVDLATGRRTGFAKEGSFAAKYLGAATLEGEVVKLEADIVKAEERMAELEEEQKVEDEGNPSPGIPELRSLDTFMARYGPIAPVGIMGGNILMEVLRVRRMREL